MDFSKTDLEAIQEHGKTVQQVNDELEMLSTGFPYPEIAAAATIDKGIFRLTPETEHLTAHIWHEYVSQGHKIMKFVPASGAASRMFKELQAFAASDSDHLTSDSLRVFFHEIEHFAFFRRLNLACVSFFHRNVDELRKEGRYRDIANTLLRQAGLNYAKLPKALILFHKIIGSNRTPIEEHMAEATQYMAGPDGTAHLHFTVSEDHLPLIRLRVKEIKHLVEKRYGVNLDISFSTQKPSTDTIAAAMDGKPFRTANGELLFRPGGHGALIENLNDLAKKGVEVAFIKNIDNVVPDSKRATSLQYKKVLGGALVGVKTRIDGYLKELDKGGVSDERMNEMLEFLHNTLHITEDDAEKLNPTQRAAYIYNKLHRPLRICGMVKNTGEPGGGPFMVFDPQDGTIAPQILEKAQIDLTDPEVKKKFMSATHFNPVDLAVALTDHKGKPYDLLRHVDKNTGFISNKSQNGVDLKALELPGLWNGAMSDWNTIFIEVPVETFNPVKEVNDLLRPAHQVTDHLASLM